jgi:hypothetical protein
VVLDFCKVEFATGEGDLLLLEEESQQQQQHKQEVQRFVKEEKEEEGMDLLDILIFC